MFAVQKAISSFALYSGTRKGEVLALHWSDINFGSKKSSFKKKLLKRMSTNPSLVLFSKIEVINRLSPGEQSILAQENRNLGIALKTLLY